MNIRICLLWIVSACLPSALAAVEATDSKPTNLLVIMTDNHGAWTLGCYGNPDIRTPNIDRLAQQGMKFTQAFACNPVCSPTRATFLTGLMPSQHGVHCFLRANRLQIGPAARNTLQEFDSLPEVLKRNGYQCGLVGKWHLGDNLQPQEGFDDYWITMPHGGTSTFYDANVIENGVIRREPTYLTDFWTDHALRFLDQSQHNSDQPFFLFLSYNGPYALGQLLLRESRNRHATYYATHPLESFPRQPMHPWQHHNRNFINNPISIRRVAAEVGGVDDGVGRVLDKLDLLGLTDNTLVVFLADQGWVGGHGGFWGMGDHTDPVTAYDGMMRIPLIIRHPGQIPAATTSDRLIGNYDVLPTILDQLRIESHDGTLAASPGVSFSAEFQPDGNPRNDGDDAVFFEFEILRAIRTNRWKYVHRHPAGPHELFDLQADPLEATNLVEIAAHAATRDQLRTRLEQFFQRHASPQYDIYRGGTSQTVRYTSN